MTDFGQCLPSKQSITMEKVKADFLKKYGPMLQSRVRSIPVYPQTNKFMVLVTRQKLGMDAGSDSTNSFNHCIHLRPSRLALFTSHGSPKWSLSGAMAPSSCGSFLRLSPNSLLYHQTETTLITEFTIDYGRLLIALHAPYCLT